MLKNKLIILPIDEDWNHTADFLRQTAITLSDDNQVVIYDQKNAYFFLRKAKKIVYPKYKNIVFHQVKYFLPFRSFAFIEQINRKLNFWLFIKKNNKVNKVLWIFYPNYFDLAKFKTKKMISLYDCVDYDRFTDNEKLLIQTVDYFFVNSLTLKKFHQKAIKKPIYINSQGFFVPDEKKIKKIKSKTHKPIIGYIGGINYRLDFCLLDKLIRNNPQWQFIFYGPEQEYLKEDIQYKTKFWLKKIKKYENTMFGKSKDRYQTYGIIKNFDVAIIPYNPEIPFNKYCYPMKVFEYLYFGKPIVSSPIEELKLKKFKKFIKLAEKESDWQKYIKYYLKNQLDLDNFKQVKQLAIANSWKNKIEKISKPMFFNNFN